MRATLVRLLALVVVGLVAGCSPADRSTQPETPEDSVDRSDPTAPAVELEPQVDITSPVLEIDVPETEPTSAGFTVVRPGDGVVAVEGDAVLVAWEMMQFNTQQIVESTADDFGGPVPITLGSGLIPAALDDALIGQAVGVRLEVVFPVGMSDLPPNFEQDQAYVLAVELVEVLESEPRAQPATTVPVEELGLLIPADGPLTAIPPSDAPLPGRNTFEVARIGTGPVVAEGDTVELDYTMSSWTTGETVYSTAVDLGGSQRIVLGDQTVPRFLEAAVFQQPVGTRLQVIYAPDLPDLPDGLASDDGYLIALDIKALP